MFPSRRESTKMTANKAAEKINVVKVSHLAPSCITQALYISLLYSSSIISAAPHDQISEVKVSFL